MNLNANGKIVVNNNGQLQELRCHVIGGKGGRLKCRMLESGWMPRKNVVVGQVVHLPKYSVFIAVDPIDDHAFPAFKDPIYDK